MINDNPVTYLVLALLLLGAIFYVLNAYINSKPKDFDPNKYVVVSSLKTNLDWGEANKKRRFF